MGRLYEVGSLSGEVGKFGEVGWSGEVGLSGEVV